MTLQSLILLPLAAALLALLIRADRPRRLLLVAVALGHLGLFLAAASTPQAPAWDGLLVLDPLGTLFLGITSILFLAASVYGLGYLGLENAGLRKDFEEGMVFANAPEAVFTACLLLFLAAMSLVTMTHHFGLLWAGIEATTLASAPLIYFHRHHRSLEACWKYLMICSVGIALALLGNILLAASFGANGAGSTLFLEDMSEAAGAMNPAWFKAAFIFIAVGYGTKMGLAPLHTWLPDAHSESPSLVSALLSGALLNCAFLGILRVHELGIAAGQAEFCRSVFILFGLLSMTFAAVFIIGQGDFKRILAYSSVEHMGILSLGVGLGHGAAFGAMLHALNHSMTKGMLFLLAGNILHAFHTKSSHDVRGVQRLMPVTGALWAAGFLAITGTPPFGLFVSEFSILKGAIDGGHTGLATAYLALLAVIFVGMATPILRMVQGTPPPHMEPSGRRESLFLTMPPMALAAAVLVMGVYVPGPVSRLLTEASRLVGAF